MVRAVVLPAAGELPEVTGIEVPEPGPGQVRVRLAAAGVCPLDLPFPDAGPEPAGPAVLGHEGAGTVVSTGPGVIGLAAGDRVILNRSPSCGSCHFCVRLREPWLCPRSRDASGGPCARTRAGTPLRPALTTAAFAQETVVAARAVLPLPDGVPLTEAALLGCAALTGHGAVHHCAQVRVGESVVVLGAGGVGLAALQSARMAGASPLVAVDLSPEREAPARAAGATRFVVASDVTAKEIRGLTGGIGADVAIECVGRAETIRTAWSATRRGGRTAVVGIGGADQQIPLSALEIFRSARTLIGCVHGNSDPARDVPALAAHVREGRMDLCALATERITLDEVPAALARMAAGNGGRSLVVF